MYGWSQKREELSRFEMTLKQMIEEAKQMAATPFGSDEDLYARSLHKSPSVRHCSYFSNKRVGLNKRVALDKGEGLNKRGGSRGSGGIFDLLN